MKALKFIVAVVVIWATIFIAVLKPTLHKTVIIDETNVSILNKPEQNMTKQEIVVWNKWRSDIGNKILKERNVPPGQPLNTINNIQFNVDKNRNIFNIKVSTEPQQYSQEAQKYYTEYLTSLNGDASLQFPKDSQRKVVFVKIPIMTSNEIQYSTPSDFSDKEGVNVTGVNVK